MVTFSRLKSLINFCQTDEAFVDYLYVLADAGVTVITPGDIDTTEKTLSHGYSTRLLQVFWLTEEEMACLDLS